MIYFFKYIALSFKNTPFPRIGRGEAELFDRSLYHITDSEDGFVTNKEESIRDTIDHLDVVSME